MKTTVNNQASLPAENRAFEEYYKNQWGERWPGLRESLLMPSSSIFYGEGLLKPYAMDRASVLAACALRLPKTGSVLDACAAPGGKSLVLASRMESRAALLSNEFSSERRRRLVNVLDEHLGEEIRARVTVSGFDAARLGRKRNEWNRFEAILLDAPCSSERHVLQNAKAFAEWKSGRPRGLAIRQWSLLSSAFLLLKSGGSLVYATCAINSEENDIPPLRLLEKYRGQVELDEPELPCGEKTKYGSLILPDTQGGMGPMFIARFRKL